MITVKNNSNHGIRVSINKWGNSGDTDECNISPQQNETWDRTDPRGFVMCINGIPYYVLANSTVEFKDDIILRDGRKLDRVW